MSSLDSRSPCGILSQGPTIAGGNMTQLSVLLGEFFTWAHCTSDEYAEGKGPNLSKDGYDECNFPKLEELITAALEIMKKDRISWDDMEDILTALAIDNESEWILDHCEDAPESFVGQLVEQGCRHRQQEARWQIAELLRRRNIPNRMKYLNMLLQDPEEYVRSRAGSSIQYLDTQFYK